MRGEGLTGNRWRKVDYASNLFMYEKSQMLPLAVALLIGRVRRDVCWAALWPKPCFKCGGPRHSPQFSSHGATPPQGGVTALTDLFPTTTTPPSPRIDLARPSFTLAQPSPPSTSPPTPSFPLFSSTNPFDRVFCSRLALVFFQFINLLYGILCLLQVQVPERGVSGDI